MRGHRVRLYPTSQQEVQLSRTVGHCRYVYNELLRKSIDDYEEWKEGRSNAKPNLSQNGLVNRIMELKPGREWLNEVSANALQQSARDLGVAFKNFFDGIRKGNRRAGYPQFHRRGRNDSFRLPSVYYKIDGNRLKLSRIDTAIRVKWDSRGLPHGSSSVTVTRTAQGHWYASFVVPYDGSRTCGEGTIGIDLGIGDLAVMSDGTKITNPKYYQRDLRKLKHAQRRLARRRKGSRNRERARIRVARLHERIANCRRDTLHKLSTELIDKNHVIVLETLKVGSLNKDRRLSKYIMDTGWAMFRDMVAYKARESGARLILVDRFYPSTQTCSACQYRHKGDHKLRLSVRKWTCPNCDTHHDRDVNAAINILQEGLRYENEVDPGGIVICSIED